MPRPERRMLDDMVLSYLIPAVDRDVFKYLATELGGELGLGNLEREDRELARRLVKRAWRRLLDDLLEIFPPGEGELR